MAKKKIKALDEKAISINGVQALSDRPNVVSSYGNSGLTPTQLKAWFDKLAIELNKKFAELSDALEQEGVDYIGLGSLDTDEDKSLSALLGDVLTGEGVKLDLSPFDESDSSRKLNEFAKMLYAEFKHLYDTPIEISAINANVSEVKENSDTKHKLELAFHFLAANPHSEDFQQQLPINERVINVSCFLPHLILGAVTPIAQDELPKATIICDKDSDGNHLEVLNLWLPRGSRGTYTFVTDIVKNASTTNTVNNIVNNFNSVLQSELKLGDDIKYPIVGDKVLITVVEYVGTNEWNGETEIVVPFNRHFLFEILSVGDNDVTVGKPKEITGIRGAKGDKGKTGDPFTITKTYPSIVAMQQDWINSNVPIGAFVAIETGDVNNPDNAKLYRKGVGGYEFITDMSGAIGLTGPSAYDVAVENGFTGTETEWLASLKGETGKAARITVTGTHTLAALDGGGDPNAAYCINTGTDDNLELELFIPRGFTGPQGEKGEPGDIENLPTAENGKLLVNDGGKVGYLDASAILGESFGNSEPTPLNVGENIDGLYAIKSASAISAIQAAAQAYNMAPADDGGDMLGGIRLGTSEGPISAVPLSLLVDLGMLEAAPDGSFALLHMESADPYYLSHPITLNDINYSAGWNSELVADDGKIFNSCVVIDIMYLGSATRELIDAIFSSTPAASVTLKEYVDGGLSKKADKTDVDSALQDKADKTYVDGAFQNKVDKVANMGLSSNDYTTVDRDKLANIENGANNYILPPASEEDKGGVKIGFSQIGTKYPVKLQDEQMYVDVPEATTTKSGLMSATDKKILQKKANAASKWIKVEGSGPNNGEYFAIEKGTYQFCPLCATENEEIRGTGLVEINDDDITGAVLSNEIWLDMNDCLEIHSYRLQLYKGYGEHSGEIYIEPQLLIYKQTDATTWTETRNCFTYKFRKIADYTEISESPIIGGDEDLEDDESPL